MDEEPLHYGDRAKVRDIEEGSFFFYGCLLYYKTSVTQGNGTYALCHPVAGGKYGRIVQDRINEWLPMTEVVSLAQVSTGM